LYYAKEERNVVSTTLVREHKKTYFTFMALTGTRKTGNSSGKEILDIPEQMVIFKFP